MSTPSLPTICIGNLQVGGTGKTPLVGWVLDQFQSRGILPGLVARGVGRKTRGLVTRPASADDPPNPTLLGDEVAMLAQEHPWLSVAVAEERSLAMEALQNLPDSPQVAVMDDGFSHLELKRDLDVLCIDANSPPWVMLPAGRLREPVSSLGRAGCIIINNENGKYLHPWQAALERFAPRKPIFKLIFKPRALFVPSKDEVLSPTDFSGKTVLAVSGIAHPDNFEVDLVDLKITPIPRRFPDHHQYTENDFENINRLAASSKCDAIITTAKDAIKWMYRISLFTIPVYVLRIAPVFTNPQDEAQLFAFLIKGYEEGCKRLSSAL